MFSVVQGRESHASPGVPIFIEDPAEYQRSRQRRNLTANVGEEQWANVVEEATKASARLHVTPMRWFHWAEMFDPVGIPVAKMAKLAPLAEMAAATPAAGEQTGSWQNWQNGDDGSLHGKGNRG